MAIPNGLSLVVFICYNFVSKNTPASRPEGIRSALIYCRSLLVAINWYIARIS